MLIPDPYQCVCEGQSETLPDQIVIISVTIHFAGCQFSDLIRGLFELIDLHLRDGVRWLRCPEDGNGGVDRVRTSGKDGFTGGWDGKFPIGSDAGTAGFEVSRFGGKIISACFGESVDGRLIFGSRSGIAEGDIQGWRSEDGSFRDFPGIRNSVEGCYKPGESFVAIDRIGDGPEIGTPLHCHAAYP